MKNRICIVFLLAWAVSFCTLPVFSGTDPASFLEIGVGARALSMGGAFTALSDDATCIYWNPAGLALMDKIYISGMGQRLSSAQWEGQSSIFPDYQFLSFLCPLTELGLEKKDGTFAIGIISMNLDNIPKTEYVDGRIVRDTFEDKESALLLSYGCPIIEDEIVFGGSLKFISQKWTKIDGADASGWGADFGILYFFSKRFRMGYMAMKSIKLKWGNDHVDQGPMRAKLGFLYTIPAKKNLDVSISMDLVQTQNRPLMSNTGVEFNIIPGISGTVGVSKFCVRAGINELYLENRYDNISELNRHLNLALGAGVNMSLFEQDFQFDYAFCSGDITSSHKFSIILGIY